jgi:hypothetical protein
MFEIVFDGLKMVLTLKKSIKKKYPFVKKIKSSSYGPKSLKMAKTHFWEKLKIKVFAQKLFLT